MHPEIRRDGPGQCPLCGMDLVPAEADAPPVTAPATVAVYTCPMHPEIRRDQPGPCPLCGMDLVPAATDTAATGTVYTCPMHPEIRRDGPGPCPLCGMDLVPAEAAAPPATAPATGTVYTCPMHPEIRRDGPGQCPLCGMDLVPVEVEAAPETPPATGTIYTCPMHPEIRRDGLGQCPLCGMDLVPAEADVPPASGKDTGAHSTHAMAKPTGRTAVAYTGHAAATGHTGLTPRQNYVMMVDMAMSTAQLPWALVLGAASALALGLLVWITPWPLATIAPPGDATSAVGELLLSRYMIGFEGAAFLILAGIVGAVIFGLPVARPSAPPSVAPPPAQAVPIPATAGAGAVYTCPMHPEIRRDGPGQCPLCGMDLVPAEAAPAPATARTTATVYTCPMHPEIRRDDPGQCPICGMDLVPEEATPPAAVVADPPNHGGHL